MILWFYQNFLKSFRETKSIELRRTFLWLLVDADTPPVGGSGLLRLAKVIPGRWSRSQAGHLPGVAGCT